MRRKLLVSLAPLLGLLAADGAFAASKAANAPLLKLFDTTWQEDLADDPLQATQLGDTQFNDKLPDMSQEALDLRQKNNYKRLQTLAKIKREKLSPADQLNYDLFQRDIKTRIGAYQFKPWMFAITTNSGPQMLAQVAEYAPFNTVKDYDNWIARINASGTYIDQWIAQLTQGTTERLTQPRLVVNKVLEQLKGPLTADPEANPFYAPFKRMPAGIPDAEKARLTAAGKAAVQTVANIGLALARRLEEQNQVKVIERDPRRARRISEQLLNTIVLSGDAADEELLIEENIDSCDVFAALTNSEEANILSAMLAKRLGARKVMALINKPSYAELMESGSIDIAISPQTITIGSLLAHVRRGDVVRVHSLRRGAAEALEAVVHGTDKTSRVVGKRVGEIPLPEGATIGAVVRGEEVHIAHHDTLIANDDHVIVFLSDRRHVEQVERLFSSPGLR